MGKAKSDTPGTVLTPCERACKPGALEAASQPALLACGWCHQHSGVPLASPTCPSNLCVPANPALLEPEAAHFYDREPERSTALLVQCMVSWAGRCAWAWARGAPVGAAGALLRISGVP